MKCSVRNIYYNCQCVSVCDLVLTLHLYMFINKLSAIVPFCCFFARLKCLGRKEQRKKYYAENKDKVSERG